MRYSVTLLKDETYGDGERQNFDILLPKSEKPTPLVIFIHGGSFVRGDKDNAYKFRFSDIDYILDKGIAFMTINYTYAKSRDNRGVFNCLDDVQRALQYIRFHAELYNIDKEKIAVYGESAGAGSSLYLALNDDMAIPGDTTLLGESTKVRCAGLLETQGTYNILRWLEIVPGLKLLMFFMGKHFKRSIAHFFGYATFTEYKEREEQLLKKIDFPELIKTSTIPLYIMNLTKGNLPRNLDIINHHKNHARILGDKLEQLGVEYHLYTSGRENDLNYTVKEFLVDQLSG